MGQAFKCEEKQLFKIGNGQELVILTVHGLSIDSLPKATYSL